MSYLVVAYPKLATDDYAFIQNYRAQYDPLFFDVVEPHFTIVFPVSSINKAEFVDEIQALTQGQQRIDFSLQAAVINKDAFDSIYHEFLVSDQGNSDIIKLHDRLYSQKLLPHLRLDIDFIPHISIGNHSNPLISKSRVDQLNSLDINIKGCIDTLDVVDYENNAVTTLFQINLN